MSKKEKLGNIYEIPLPNGKKAYGRLYKEGVLGIYKGVYNSLSELPLLEKYLFFVCVYEDILKDGKWPIVGNRSFENEEESWSPPWCVVDALTKKGSIYYKGEFFDCTYEECKDLEIASVWERHHVIDRIMGGYKWKENLPKPHNI